MARSIAGEFFGMWGKLVISVILLPMLVHSILGCCWHHAHSECDLACRHSMAESHAGHRHAHDQASENHDPVVPAPCEHNESCNDVRCVYLAVEPVRNVLSFDLQSQFAVWDDCCVLIHSATVTASRNPQRCQHVPASSQHRALTQVWVV